MRKSIVVTLLVLCAVDSFSQNWNEWFRQKQTIKKYLLEQIAALRVYVGYVEKGYSIAKQGLNTLHDIKQGDFRLHDSYFQSLRDVNPRVKGYSKVAAIIAMQLSIVKRTKECLAAIRELDQLTPDELAQSQLTIDNLINDCIANVDVLFVLVTSGEVEMKDDERLRRIDSLYADMQDKVTFCNSYTEELTLLAVQRIREYHEINMSMKLNNVR